MGTYNTISPKPATAVSALSEAAIAKPIISTKLLIFTRVNDIVNDEIGESGRALATGRLRNPDTGTRAGAWGAAGGMPRRLDTAPTGTHQQEKTPPPPTC
jgi:hypothetical protein